MWLRWLLVCSQVQQCLRSWVLKPSSREALLSMPRGSLSFRRLWRWLLLRSTLFLSLCALAITSLLFFALVLALALGLLPLWLCTGACLEIKDAVLREIERERR